MLATQAQTKTNAPAKTYTLEELQTLKSEWVQDAERNGYFEAAKTVALTLGKRFEKALHHPWDQKPAWMWKSGNVEITVFYRCPGYMPARRAFEDQWLLTVAIDGPHIIPQGKAPLEIGDAKVVARYCFSNNPARDTNALFVPGRWVSRIMHALDEAQAVIEAEQEKDRKAEREKLMEELLIGQEV